MDEFTELFEKSKNDHESKMIVGSEVRYIINAVRSERARITALETALAAMTAERDESGRRLGEFQLRLAGALIASEGGNGCPDGAIECIRTCPTIASVMRLRAERDARDVALRAAVASCKCRGTGQVQRWCTLCGDSTFDHDCNDRMEDCDRDWCIAARAVLARLALAVAEVRMARTWIADQRTHDGAVFATYGEYSPEYMAARAATDADPVLAKMIGGGE